MTRRVGNMVILSVEKPQQCDKCGRIAELRPYGPGGSCICFDCAMEDEKGTRERMAELLFDIPTP